MTIKQNAIPWARLSAEAAAIVLSILLAFAIDAWWDARQEQAEEREILIGLQAEFVDLRGRLDLWANMNRDGIRFIEEFLAGPVEGMDPVSVESAIVYSYFVNVLDQGGALDALLASGRLERISDRDIRVKLAKWPDWLEDIHTNDLSARGFSWGEIMPFLAKRGIPDKHCATGIYVCPVAGPVPEIYVSLAQDPEYRALIILRRAMMEFAAGDHENARAEADKMIAMIEERLKLLGAENGD